MKSKEFEQLCLDRVRYERDQGLATMNRCGVQGSLIGGEWKPTESFPDFEGVLQGGQQFTFDCKVCSQGSFSLDEYQEGFKRHKRRQFDYLMERASFGAISFLAIHWNARQLTTRADPEQTTAIPVHPRLDLWMDFARGEIKRITRAEAPRYGILIEWNAPGRRRKDTPDLLTAIHTLRRVAVFSNADLKGFRKCRAR